MSDSLQIGMQAMTVREYGDAGKVFKQETVPIPTLRDKDVLVQLSVTGINQTDTKKNVEGHQCLKGSMSLVVIWY